MSGIGHVIRFHKPVKHGVGGTPVLEGHTNYLYRDRDGYISMGAFFAPIEYSFHKSSPIIGLSVRTLHYSFFFKFIYILQTYEVVFMRERLVRSPVSSECVRNIHARPFSLTSVSHSSVIRSSGPLIIEWKKSRFDAVSFKM